MKRSADPLAADGFRSLWFVLCTSLATSCIDTPAGPLAPVLGDVQSPTSTAVQTIVGAKQSATALEVGVNGSAPLVIALDEATRWSALIALVEGENHITAVALDAAGRRSPQVLAVILLDTAPPAAPRLAAPPLRTLRDTVSIEGTVNLGDLPFLNGRSLVLESDASSFTATVELELGRNAVRIASRDIAGNDSALTAFVIERLAELPFTTTPAPSLVGRAQLIDGALSLSGTRGDGVEVALGGVVVVQGNAPAGPWVTSVVLVDGANNFTMTGAFAGEPSSAVAFDVTIEADLGDPVLTLTAPRDFALVGGRLILSGTASDAHGSVQVCACIGVCSGASGSGCASAGSGGTLIALAANDGPFVADIDLVGDSALQDGQLTDVSVIAVDGAGNEAVLVTPVLLFRSPIVVAEPAGVVTAVDLAGGSVDGGALVWTDAAGAAGSSIDVEGGSWSPSERTLATAGASSPRVARAGSTTHLIWLKDGDLMYASDDGSAHLVTSGALVPVASADVSSDATDETGATALIAFSQGDVVQTTSGAGAVWSAAVTISDLITLGPSELVVADGGAAVAWRETSARDGALDDTDVVLVSRAGALPSAPLLVSADQGTFLDAASSAPSAAVLGDGAIVIAWLDDSRGVVARIDLSGAAPVVGVPVEVTNVPGHGAASAVFLACDVSTALAVPGSEQLLVGWLDNGVSLLSGASAPALLVRRGSLASLGTARVLSSAPASSPTGFVSGSVAELSWIEGGDALLFALELP